MYSSFRLFSFLALAVYILYWVLGVYKPALVQEPNYLHTDGSRILDSNGNEVIITGISWFGLETPNYAPHGLWARSLDSFLDQIVELGFNTIRLPYSNQHVEPTSVPNGINYDLNPDLKGLNGLEIMDTIIAEAGERGLKVILDRHRPDSHSQSELWYTAQYGEERWINDWIMLAERYSGDDTVIGMDEEELGHSVADRLTVRSAVLSGRTNIRELMAATKRCTILLTNDTGPMHMAAAFAVPVVAVFGPTDWKTTAPYGQEASIVRQPVDCAPCLLRECPIDHRCMTGVTVDMVTQAAVGQLADKVQPSAVADHPAPVTGHSPLQGVTVFLDRDGTLNPDPGYMFS